MGVSKMLRILLVRSRHLGDGATTYKKLMD